MHNSEQDAEDGAFAPFNGVPDSLCHHKKVGLTLAMPLAVWEQRGNALNDLLAHQQDMLRAVIEPQEQLLEPYIHLRNPLNPNTSVRAEAAFMLPYKDLILMFAVIPGDNIKIPECNALHLQLVAAVRRLGVS
jgi:hypothetical protein